jgi:hypothetical protein
MKSSIGTQVISSSGNSPHPTAVTHIPTLLATLSGLGVDMWITAPPQNTTSAVPIIPDLP